MTRAQKLRWYAGQLVTEATGDEKVGAYMTATSRYLQAADILLLLAKVEENYTAWKYYTDTAAECQKRAKRLIALAPKDDGVPGPVATAPGTTPPS
jgi:hypothetical protein